MYFVLNCDSPSTELERSQSTLETTRKQLCDKETFAKELEKTVYSLTTKYEALLSDHELQKKRSARLFQYIFLYSCSAKPLQRRLSTHRVKYPVKSKPQ